MRRLVCVCLYNSYISPRAAVLEAASQQEEKDAKKYNNGILQTKKVRHFLKIFDDTCNDALN